MHRLVRVREVERKYRATPLQQDAPDGSLVEAMISYGYIEEKGADDPDPRNMFPCTRDGPIRLRDDKTAGDGLNGSIPLNESDLSGVKAEKGDPIKIYAEANGRWILYERDTYSDRAGVGMPKGHREKLDLDSENRTIELWIDEADETSEKSGPTESENSDKQVSLTGTQVDKQEYVQIPEEDPLTYHHVSSSDDGTTECGISFGEQANRFTDPGDALNQCSDCAIRSSDDMTNKELVEWLGEQAGFEADNGTPAYLSKGQLVALRDYILDLQDSQGDASGNEATSLSLTSPSVSSSS
jgi:hypothetical protein